MDSKYILSKKLNFRKKEKKRRKKEKEKNCIPDVPGFRKQHRQKLCLHPPLPEGRVVPYRLDLFSNVQPALTNVTVDSNEPISLDYLPDLEGREQDLGLLDEELEMDFKKQCSVM